MSPSNKSVDEAINDALLEKLRSCATKPQETGDTFRNVVAKIQARVTSSGNHSKRQFSLLSFEAIVSLYSDETRSPLSFILLFFLEHEKTFSTSLECGSKVLNESKQIGHFKTGLVPLNCYFYRERWLLFHRTNHQKLARFIITAVITRCLHAAVLLREINARQFFSPLKRRVSQFSSSRRATTEAQRSINVTNTRTRNVKVSCRKNEHRSREKASLLSRWNPWKSGSLSIVPRLLPLFFSRVTYFSGKKGRKLKEGETMNSKQTIPQMHA